jgi:hypothetical protein
MSWSALQPDWWGVGTTWAGILTPSGPFQQSPVIRVNGTDITSSVQGRVTIRRGRDSVYTEPSAGYASVDVLGNGLTFRVGQPITITLNSPTDTPRRLFTGTISDVDGQAERVAGGVLMRFRLTAVGPLARLNRRTVLFDGSASELDGARVLAALLAGLAAPFEEVPSSVSWDDADVSWAAFDGIDDSLIDDGVFTLAALGTAESGYNPLRVAQEAAFSGLGMIYETADGAVAYADAARRADNADAGYTAIDADVLDVAGVQVSSQLADITNRVTVTFDGGAVTVTDDDSLVEFGQFAQQFDTLLVNESNAELWAERYVGNHALPVFRADQFRLNLAGVPLDIVDMLLTVEPNDALEFTGLPTALGLGANFEGFVEGVEWTLDPFRTDVGLFVSDAQLSLGSIWFGRVDGTLAWSAVGSATAWQDVERTLV